MKLRMVAVVLFLRKKEIRTISFALGCIRHVDINVTSGKLHFRVYSREAKWRIAECRERYSHGHQGERWL